MARGQNRHAYSLATLASLMTEEVPRLIKVELVVEPSINAAVGVLMVAMSKSCWMDPIIDFLVEDRVPDDEKEASRVRCDCTSCQQIVSCTRGLLRGHIFYAYSLRKLMNSWLNSMKGCAAVMLGDTHWHTEQ